MVSFKDTTPCRPAGLVAVTVPKLAETLVAATLSKLTATQPSEVPDIVTTVPPVIKPDEGLMDVIVGGLFPLQDANATCAAMMVTNEKPKRISTHLSTTNEAFAYQRHDEPQVVT